LTGRRFSYIIKPPKRAAIAPLIRPHWICPRASIPALPLCVAEALAAVPLSVAVAVAVPEAEPEALPVSAAPSLPPPVDLGAELSLESAAALA